jgi:PHD/YefM family antitoxin component YafN of YafNO toxin-antitoxin module
MIDLNDIRSLTEFQRHSKAHIRRLKKTGRPSILTVNGQAEVVVQDVASYQRLLEAAEQASAAAAIRVGLEQMRRGEGVDFEEAAARLRVKHVGRSTGKGARGRKSA